MSVAAPPALDARSEFLRGARAFVPLAISIAAYGVVWGVLAGQAGMSALEVLMMCALVFAGASQFVALDMWTPGALPVVSIVVAVGIVNLRMALMSATMRPILSGQPLWRQLFGIYTVSDEQWALTMAEHGRGRAATISAPRSLLPHLGGLAAAGRLVGSAIDDPTTYGLDFAFTATFLALLFGMWRGRADLVPWIVAAPSPLPRRGWCRATGTSSRAGSLAASPAPSPKR